MTTSLWAGAAALACVLLALPATPQARGRALDAAVLDELNLARTAPARYARLLEAEARRSRAAGAYDDPYAFQEAVGFLRRQAPLPPLRSDTALAGAALSHAAYQGRTGGFGHAGPGGESLGDRLRRRGAFAMLMAEDISYGYLTPREVVMQLIVDSGVPGRGHRDNIFNPLFQRAGVACAPHRTYGAVCVIDFTARLMRR